MPTQTSFLPSPPLLARLPVRERPAERLYLAGSGAMNLTELLAAIIGGPRQLELAQRLVTQWGAALPQVGQVELEQLPGIGRQTAARIVAALELGRRFAATVPEEAPQITAPQDAADLLIPLIGGPQEQEQFVVLYLNIRNRVIDQEVLYRGTLNTSVVRRAEIFRGAVRRNAAAVIVAHNHPSGEVRPSPEDIALTRALVHGGRLVEVDVLDHLIIGGQRFWSLREHHSECFETQPGLS